MILFLIVSVGLGSTHTLSTRAMVWSEIQLGKNSLPHSSGFWRIRFLQAVGIRIRFLAGYCLEVALSFLPCDPCFQHDSLLFKAARKWTTCKTSTTILYKMVTCMKSQMLCYHYHVLLVRNTSQVLYTLRWNQLCEGSVPGEGNFGAHLLRWPQN